jgi:aminoglycoside phosphotransferase (APT) family kinase protein
VEKSSLTCDFGDRNKMMNASIPNRFKDFLSIKHGFRNVVIKHAEVLFGGYSRESWRIDASWLNKNGEPTEQSMVLRLDPPSSLLDSNRTTEYAMYQAFWKVKGVPVPEPLFNEDDPCLLGKPFLVMSRLDGVAWPGEIRKPEYKDKWIGIASQMFEILGLIAAQDYRNLGLDVLMKVPSVEEVWKIQLDYWVKIILENHIGPLPVISAAIRQLRREPPPAPPKLSVVHGDYRIGNYLYSPQGIIGILDWELAHLGDPTEDLAWAFSGNWQFQLAPGKIAGKLSQNEAIHIWENASGLRINRDALRWWMLFSHVKLYAMWVSAAKRATTESERSLMNSDAAWKNMYAQELWILEDMGGSK